MVVSEHSRSPVARTSIGNALYLGYGTGSGGSYTLSGSGRLSATLRDRGLFRLGGFREVRRDQHYQRRPLSRVEFRQQRHLSLNGGVLVLSVLIQGSGTAAFNFNGGTLQAGSGFSTSVPMTLGTSGSGATFDTAGYAVTLSGSLSGPGSLTKVGSGTLTLAGSNSFTGGTTIFGRRDLVEQRQCRCKTAP